MAKAAVSAIIGRTIGGKFVVEAHVGSGAMGEVFRARHAVLGSPVAVKLLRPELALEATFAERFFREAKAASRLEHPASIRVIDYGADAEDGQLYIAMEYIDGRDLLRVISEDWPMPDSRVVDILLQTLSALGTAHEIGIIHRDLKPENIMVVSTQDDDGRARDIVKVCDFGIAKISDPRAFQTDGGKALTSTGAIVGTPEYMSPEQSRGDSLDARSDLYSIGVVLFQLLTRRVPFTAESSLGVVLKQVTDAPPLPSSFVPSINPRLESICMKALQKDPNQRYQNARAMRKDLRDALGSGAGVAYTESAPRLVRTNMPPSSTAPTVQVDATSIPPNYFQPRDLLPKETTLGNESARLDEPPRRKSTAIVLIAVGACVIIGIAALIAPALRRETHAAGVVTSTAPSAADLVPLEEAPNFAAPLASASTSASKPSFGKPSQGTAPPPSAATPSLSVIATTTATASVTPPATAVATTTTPPASSAISAAPIDTTRAHVLFSTISPTGVTASGVRTLLGSVHGPLNNCYKSALTARGAPVGGTVTLSLSIDSSANVASAVVTPAIELKTLSRCFGGVLMGRGLNPHAMQDSSATADIQIILAPQ